MNGENENESVSLLSEEHPEAPPQEFSSEAEAAVSEEAAAEENPNTEEFLQEQVQQTEALLGDPIESAVTTPNEEIPTVSLQIEMQQESQVNHLKELFNAWKLELAPHFPRTLIPRLQEAEAVQLMQWLLAAGFSVKAAMQWPNVEPAFSENQETPGHQAEGAPAVSLPDSAPEVMLLTSEQLPQFTQMQSLGLVTAHQSLSRRFFKEEDLQQEVDRELKKMQRTSSSQFASSTFAKIFRELCGELQRQALTLGANAVLGIHLQCHTEEEHRDPSLDQLRLIAIGTASIVEK